MTLPSINPAIARIGWQFVVMDTQMVGQRRYLPWLVNTVLGIGVAIASGCSQTPPNVATTPTAEPTATTAQRSPTTLRLLYSRLPTTLNPHLAAGVQDFEAGRIVLEPLATANERGELVPILAAEIPTVDNEGLAADGKSVTWTLKSDVKWSDGEALTAEDVVFTFDFVSNSEVGAATAQYYEAVESVEAIDDQTVKINFKEVTAAWQIPFTGQTGVVLPKHIFEPVNGPEARLAEVNLQPIGTGAYQVASFQPGGILFEPNPNYRGNQPAFEAVEFVGGLAPYAAAREVLSTGEADFAHNLQVEIDLLEDLQQDGEGVVVPVFGGLVERVMLNPTDPFRETESGERSSLTTTHPFFDDKRVRQAIAYAIDRDTIAEELYGFTGQPTAQILVAPLPYANPGTIPYEFDLDKAKALLDEAGWVDTDEDGIRDRDGVPMEIVFQTSVNPVRQKTQTLVEQNLQELGIDVDIKRVRVDDFFSGDPQQTNSINHFYADMQAYTTGNDHPDPTIYLGWWTCEQIATQANQWQKPNNARYCSAEYDELWEAASQELNSEKRAALFQEMDALLAEDVAAIPIVHRAIANGVSQDLVGLEPTPWDTSTWDIARWQRQKD
ncbi:peptide ABC transporter substrate-binding protein [Oscillatoria sp. CS-180]|uniref:peptide ABC transporter substrate-binding protein n=1 Tax=Oscillatoria sp. CS-180 TaxID=3021720 RepID=UPI00232FD20A|nr:peptide ABC transporter substrate-binding protein [Oscillatoria sp. CS-180]MDB9524855.1 peptide ABC transporter substrate-binding protein [Oscillatoria sp. CS-180]